MQNTGQNQIQQNIRNGTSAFNGVAASGKYPTQTKQRQPINTQKVQQNMKSPLDIIKQLKQEISRLQDENEDFKFQLEEMTQAFLKEKDSNHYYRQKCKESQNAADTSDNQKVVDRLVKKQIQIKEQYYLKQIHEQKQIIEKYKKLKVCLSKNVIELQEKMKIIKDELQYSQKIIQQYNQNHYKKNSISSDEDGIKGQKTKYNQSPTLPEGLGQKKKSNKIIDIETIKDKNYQSRTNVIRNGIQVAKSLAVKRNMNLDKSSKYDWLFNEDDTSMTRDEILSPNEDSSRIIQQNSCKKMIKTNINDKNQDSYRQYQGCDTLINLKNQKEITNEDMSHNDFAMAELRQSLVQKSLMSVKGFFMKAAEGLKPRQSIENFIHTENYQKDEVKEFDDLNLKKIKKMKNHDQQVNHEQIELELQQDKSFKDTSVGSPSKQKQINSNSVYDQNPFEFDDNEF